MKAITFSKPLEVNVERVPDPGIIDAGDVIVEVLYSALCGSDLHVYRGHETGQDSGTIMGHEFVGKVVELGKEVKKFKKGDWVVSPFTTNCGSCYYCNIGLTCRCEKGQLFGWVEQGKGLQGAQAEFVRVPLAEGSLISFDKHLTPEHVLFSGDILATGYYCASRADIEEGSLVAVIGCGPVGLMAIFAAYELGAAQVIAIDGIPERLAKAKEFGAIPLNYHQVSVQEEVLERTDGRGIGAILEAVGSSAAGRLAYDLARPGATISTVGVHTSQVIDFSPVEAYNKNLCYKIGRAPARYFMEEMITLIESEKYPIGSIISHRLSLEDGPKAYDIFDKKKDNCLKIIFSR